LTELIGDIVLACSGGTATPVGTAIPTANITVSLGTQVTSRILSSTGTTGISEALLLIDEPGAAGLATPVAGFGPAAPQIGCSPTTTGGTCTLFAQNQPAVNGGTLQVASASATAAVNGPNMFLGVLASNQVTFFGIPILAPVSSGTTRIFRITNVRANVAGLGGGGLAGTTQLLASVSISGSTSVPVNNPVQIAGFVQAGLNPTLTRVRNANNSDAPATSNGSPFQQCGPGSTGGRPLGAAVLQYTENFGTAFKTRVAPTATTSGQAPSLQNIPGTIYNSESGFVIPQSFAIVGGVATGSNTIGLADYGTRLKAVFNNIPAGVRIFVSTTNLASNTSSVTTPQPPAVTGVTNAAGATVNTSYAQLVNGEASPEGSFLASTTFTSSAQTTALTELSVAGGSATAVWEVINTDATRNETLNFGVWTQFTANPGNNSPPPGVATVNLSYAPTAPVPFSSTAGATASGSLTIPRFADTSTAKNILVINICQTLLLFPFVTNVSGFDTGIAIANPSTDPVGTAAQNGKCTLNWYDGTGKTPAVDTGNIATGTVYTTLASTSAAGFTGYMMALCNFQYAHGFAFISDIGARNLAMGYLALVVNNGGVVRDGAPPAESLAH